MFQKSFIADFFKFKFHMKFYKGDFSIEMPIAMAGHAMTHLPLLSRLYGALHQQLKVFNLN